MSDVEIRGLEPLIRRMQKFPKELHRAVKVTMTASLLTLWESVPPYPEPKNPNSTYVRKGAGGLGGSLGSSESGAKGSGQPDIYEARSMGGGDVEGHFGTRLNYAPYVIGEGTQAEMHEGWWWTMTDIVKGAEEKLLRHWQNLEAKLAAFLDRKG